MLGSVHPSLVTTYALPVVFVLYARGGRPDREAIPLRLLIVAGVGLLQCRYRSGQLVDECLTLGIDPARCIRGMACGPRASSWWLGSITAFATVLALFAAHFAGREQKTPNARQPPMR